MSRYTYASSAGRYLENDILKKIGLVLLILIFMVLMAVTAALAEDGKAPELPDQVKAAFDEKVKIEDAIQLDNVSGTNYIFTVSTENGKKHTLTWFAQIKGEWKKLGKCSSVLPYGEGQVFVSRHSDNTVWGGWSDGEMQRYKDTLGFDVIRIDPEHEEYYMQWVGIHYINHEFQVTDWQDRSKSTEVGYVNGSRICYYDPSVGGAVKSVPLYSSFSVKSEFASLPKSYREARKKYNDPPKIPAGTLSAKRVRFTENQVIPVYQGPGESYGQAGAGKAVVSTNDWIQVFGREGDWVMIQYDITSDHMRIGWIPDSTLPRSAQVDALIWNKQATLTVADTTLTDDPLFSKTAVIAIPAGASVVKLAAMGDWAYVEYQGVSTVRGFVPAGDLAILEDVETK